MIALGKLLVSLSIRQKLDYAVSIARSNDIKKLPKMGAILYLRNKPVSIGWNQKKTHPLAKRFQKNDKSDCLHAEIDAIKNALKFYTKDEISKMTLFVARVLKNGKTALAAPCKGCAAAIRHYKIKKVYWTEDTEGHITGIKP